MMTIDFEDVKAIRDALRKYAEECEKRAETPGYFQRHWEDEGNRCHRLAREFEDVLPDIFLGRTKMVKVVYNTEEEG